LDTIDKKIIDLLMVDGRLSCADLARSIGAVTERSIRYRLNRLLENKTIRVGAIANLQTLGYTVTAFVAVEVEPGMVMAVAKQAANHEQVVYAALATGEYDITLQLVARSLSELTTFVAEVVGKIPGVRKTTTSIVPVVIKDIFNWQIPATLVNNEPAE